MASPLIQTWLRVDITFIHMTTLATKTFSFTNRMPIAETSVVYFPLLKAISGCGLTVGQDGMPTQQTGSIQISDSFDSIGLELRVCDLLQEYTCNEQVVSIYDAQTVITDTSPAADFALRWQGKCSSCSHNGEQLSISVKSLGLPQETATYDVGDKLFALVTTATSAINESARGKTLPVVFGDNVQLPGIQLTVPSTVAGESYYAFQAQRDGGNGINTLWAKDANSNYRNIISGAEATDAAEYWATLAPASEYPGGVNATPLIGTFEYAYPLDQVIVGGGYSGETLAYSPFVVTSARVRMKGQGNGALSPTGQMTCTIYQKTDTGGNSLPSKAIASCTVNKSDYYTEIRGASNFWMYFEFEKPIVLEDDGNYPLAASYVIAFRETEFAGSTVDFVWGDYGSVRLGSGLGYWKKDADGNWGSFVETADIPLWEVACVYWEDSNIVSNEDGKDWIVPCIALSQENNPKEATKFSSLALDLVAEAPGSNNSYVHYPHQAIKTIVGYWVGATWYDDDAWDWTKFDTAYTNIFTAGGVFERQVCGSTSGRQTIEQVIAAICKQTACKVIQLLSGKFAMWPWGTTGTVQKVLTDEDATITGLTRLDASSTINLVNLSGGKTIINSAKDQNALQDDAKGDAFATKSGPGFDSMGTYLSTASNALYGQKELAATSCNFLGRQQDIDFLARYYMACFDHPHVTVQMDAPYWENKTLELLDIVEILSAYLPASGGTSQQGREANYLGRYNPAHKGHYVKRAQRYRTEIVGRQIDWQQGSFPKLSLECRIIKPYHTNDPT